MMRMKMLTNHSGHRGFALPFCPLPPDRARSEAAGRVASGRTPLTRAFPNLQCAWFLLLFCASPHANHTLQTLPPFESAYYARAHDQAVWGTLQKCLGTATSLATCIAAGSACNQRGEGGQPPDDVQPLASREAPVVLGLRGLAAAHGKSVEFSRWGAGLTGWLEQSHAGGQGTELPTTRTAP